MVEDEIKLYEGDKIVLPHSGFVIEDLEEVVYEVEEHHPSPLDWPLSFRVWYDREEVSYQSDDGRSGPRSLFTPARFFCYQRW
jgi:hypothetical protein